MPATPATTVTRRLARAALAASLLFIFGTTLVPGSGPAVEFVGCFVCGNRGWSDAIVNVILYAPLGASLAALGRRGPRAVAVGFLLSACIELTQAFLPGRDPSLGDVTFNTLGTAAGQALWWAGTRWILPAPRTAGRLCLGAALAAVGVFALTGRMLAPALPLASFSAWFVPDVAEMEWYHGRVLETTLGPVRFRGDRAPPPQRIRRLLLEGAPLHITAVAGPRVHSLAPLFLIVDDNDQEVFLLGPDRDDLTLRYRTRAWRWRLDAPDLRLRGALRDVSRGDTLRIGAWREGRGYCLSVDERAACDLGFTLGTGWALLYYPRHFPAWLQAGLGMMWVGGFAGLVGVWSRRRLTTWVAILLFAAGLVWLPAPLGLLPTPLSQVVGALLGWGSGRGLGWWLESRSA
jgi:VanZ like family